MRQSLPEPDPRQQIDRTTPSHAAGLARDAHRHFDVLRRIEFRHQMMELKDEADVPVAKPYERGIVERTKIRICDDDLSGVCTIQSAEQVQERALPYSRRADNRDHLAIGNVQLEIAKHVDPLRTKLVDLVEAVDVDECHAIRT